MQLRLDDVEKLVEMVAASHVSEVIVEEGARRVTVRKGAPPSAPAPLPVGSAAVPAAVEMSAAPAAPSAASENEGEGVVSASMVGVFRPSERPVTVGQTVVPGQVVGAIEAMKLMNDVRAGVGGVVSEVLVEDGSPVEYGQPLLVLRPGE